jgi:hypothetical protein
MMITTAKLNLTSGIHSLLPIGLAMGTLAVIWPAFAHAMEVWSTTEEFSYGYLIPLVSIADRR